MQINLEGIHYKYPNTSNDVFIDLSLNIFGPGFHALFGPSGVGKTTLAKMITGEIQDFSGRLALPEISEILYTYNLERIPGWSNVRDHLNATTLEANKDKIIDLVSSLGLEACMDSRFSQLSLGQQNRTNLIRYLLQDFDLLIMDESLANVDEITKEKIILKIKHMFPNRCFFYISHNVVEVAKFCKQILVLRGCHKIPQAVILQGQNFTNGQSLNNKELEYTMLEIVNAS